MWDELLRGVDKLQLELLRRICKEKLASVKKMEKTACPLPNWARGQATDFFHEEAAELAIEVMKDVNNK